MADKLVEFLFGIFKNDYLTVLFISAFPLVELKGAIPVGLKAGLPLIQSAALAYVGSSLVCIPLYFLLLPVFNLLKRIGFIKKVVLKVESFLRAKALKLATNAKNGRMASSMSSEEREKKTDGLMLFGLFLFVAVPLPLTGVWTGTAIAVFLGIRGYKSFIALFAGNFVAGSLVTLFTFLFKDNVDYVIYALTLIAIIMLIVAIVKIARAPSSSGENDVDAENKNG